MGDYYLKTKDEVYSVLSDLCKSEIDRLRGRDHVTYKLIRISGIGDAQSKRVMTPCNKSGIIRQSTSGYTPEVNAYVER